MSDVASDMPYLGKQNHSSDFLTTQSQVTNTQLNHVCVWRQHTQDRTHSILHSRQNTEHIPYTMTVSSAAAEASAASQALTKLFMNQHRHHPGSLFQLHHSVSCNLGIASPEAQQISS
jgi:hypothetical protein